MINKSSKIYIAGHNGLVGSAIKKELEIRMRKYLLLRQDLWAIVALQADIYKFYWKLYVRRTICSSELDFFVKLVIFILLFYYDNIFMFNIKFLCYGKERPRKNP